MAQARFFTDEDVYGVSAVALRRAGCDAVSTPETGRLGETDESQLQWATDRGRVLTTLQGTRALCGFWAQDRRTAPVRQR
jgi:hypothetical protein